jgi:hypothetical protein
MNLQWRKATYSSGNGGNCIEVATADHTVAIRDSKDPDGPRLAFRLHAWKAFTARVKGRVADQVKRSLAADPPEITKRLQASCWRVRVRAAAPGAPCE